MLAKPITALMLGASLLFSPMLQASDVETALSLAERSQPQLHESESRWEEWERVRLRALLKLQRWQEVVQRVDYYAQSASPDFSRWALLKKIDAELAMGHSAEALASLRKLIWADRHEEAETDDVQLVLLRRAIIRSYLVAHRYRDAYTAVRRLRQDTLNQDPTVNRLYVYVLLLSERWSEAGRYLSTDESVEGRVLLQIVNLQQLDAPPADMQNGIEAMLLAGGLSDDVLYYGWLSLVAAADRSGLRQEKVRAMESVLLQRLEGTRVLSQNVLNADDLWDAYNEVGREIGNERQLLIGNDESWLAAAKAQDNNPETTRMLAVVVAMDGYSPDNRVTALELMNQTFSNSSEDQMLRKKLFLNSSRIKFSDIPDSIRLTLAEQALGKE